MVSGLDMYLFPLHFSLCTYGVTTRPCGYAHLGMFMFTFIVRVVTYDYSGEMDGFGWHVCMRSYKVGG